MSASRFTPLPASLDGGQAAALSTAATPLDVLFDVPPAASSLWLQCTSGQDLEYRLDGAVSGSGWLVLPAFWYLPLANGASLNGLVLRAVGSTATVAVAFSNGSIGPIPPIPVGAGSSGPPPPPGLTSIPTPNVSHVMPAPTGNDATGQPYRLDLPFASLAAAVAASGPGDTINVWAGTYTVANVVAPGMTINLLGAELQDNGADPIFGGDGGGMGMSVTGTGLINAVNGAAWAIDIDNLARFVLDVPVEAGDQGIQISGNADCIIRATVSALIIALHIDGNVSVYADVHGPIIADAVNQSMVIYGNVVSVENAIYCEDGYLNIYGDVSSQGAEAISVNDTGRVVLHGNVIAASLGVLCTGAAYADVRGDITAGDGAAWLVINGAQLHVSGTQSSGGPTVGQLGAGLAVINGDVLGLGSATSGILLSHADAVLNMHGDIQVTGGTALGITAGSAVVYGDISTDPDEASATAVELNGFNLSVLIHGDVTGSLYGIYMSHTGEVKVYGDVRATAGGAAILGLSGNAYIYGDCIGQGEFSSGINNADASIEVWGDSIAEQDGWGVNVGAGAVVVHGNAICLGDSYGASVQQNGGDLTVDGEIRSGFTSGAAYVFTTVGGSLTMGKGATNTGGGGPALHVIGNMATVTIMGGAYLRAAGASASITNSGGGATVRSYGAYANAAEGAGITIAGVLNVLP